jgi:hypothetical protein
MKETLTDAMLRRTGNLRQLAEMAGVHIVGGVGLEIRRGGAAECASGPTALRRRTVSQR